VGEIKRESHLFTWKPGIRKDGDWGREGGGKGEWTGDDDCRRITLLGGYIVRVYSTSNDIF